MPEAKLIGSNIVGSLRFSSSDRERGFLAEAGSSFGFPLMQKRLMSTGVSQILQDVEDLSLKALVTSRCASRQLRIDNGRTSQLARMEERVVALEKEKTALEEALIAARAEARNHAKAAEAARRDALAAEKAKENAEKTKVEAEEAGGLPKLNVPVEKMLFSDGAPLSAPSQIWCKLTFTDCSRSSLLTLRRYRKRRTSK